MSDDGKAPARVQEFRRLFLDLRINDQLSYYDGRREEYRAAHRQVVVVRNLLLGIAAALGGIGQVVPENLRAVLGLVAALLAALATAVTAFETLMGFSHLDKLYADAARNLRKAALDWQSPEAAPDNLENEVERVEGIFTSERGQWGQLLVTTTKGEQPPKQPAGG